MRAPYVMPQRISAPSLTIAGSRATDRGMIMTLLQVALGGAIGAVLRFVAGLGVARLTGPAFPLGALGVNVLGSFLIGAFVVFAFQRDMQQLGPLMMTGLLGGFTTFSTFSLEAFMLYERGQIGAAGLYVVLSVCLSLMAIGLGVWLAREIWA